MSVSVLGKFFALPVAGSRRLFGSGARLSFGAVILRIPWLGFAGVLQE